MTHLENADTALGLTLSLGGTFSGRKQPAASGLFYPEESETLREEVESFLRSSREDHSGHGGIPRALLVPHAGYRYSGRVAGAGFRAWRGAKEGVTVFLLGPSHRVPLTGFALPSHAAFRTPLGDAAVATDIGGELLLRKGVRICDEAFSQEHSLEVELPFLQVIFGSSLRVVPLLVGQVTPEAVSQILETYWDRPNTLFVVSSDLSHFLDDRTAQERDEATISHVLRGGEPTLTFEDACGCSALNGLLLWSLRRRLLPQLFMMNNSSEAGGGTDRVVGYAAVGFWDAASGTESSVA